MTKLQFLIEKCKKRVFCSKTVYFCIFSHAFCNFLLKYTEK